ncbi:hypothetical protein VTJ49DRAFT_7737 [Mycothermus thermophilus]|uniref:MYND-type domain-containing protein n=1 Tax=Humicola insolens TaxID=85995 RepID=A0ABR3VGY3_HUMIN
MAAPSHPGRFRPALSLTEDLPRGLDAAILQLESFDTRDILYTAYTEQSVSGRNIDITVCNADAHAIARNILLYTLALDLAGDGNPTAAQLWSIWNIYYTRCLREPDFNLLVSQLRKLVQLSESLQAWNSGPYGAVLRFRTQDSLSIVRGVWSIDVVNQSQISSDSTVADAGLAQSGPGHISKQRIAPGCAPLAAQMAEKVLSAVQHFGPLELAESEYGAGAAAPRQFDVIDASALSEECTLDLLLAAEPLLKDAPSSTLYTAGSYPLNDSNAFEALLNGRTTSISLLLGLLPAEYWTNARMISLTDQILMAWSDKASTDTKKVLSELRLSWKHTKYLVGQQLPVPLQTNVDGLVDLIRHIYLDLAEKSTSKKYYAPGTTAVLLKALARRAQIDPAELAERFLSALAQPPSQGDLEVFALEGLAIPPTLAQATGSQGDQHITGLNCASTVAKPADESSPEFTTTADFDPNHTGDIVTITERLNIVSDQGKQLLADRAPIEVRQSSLTTLDIIFYGKDRALWGKERALVLPMTYPVPILKDGSKTRIARTSGYIEITAPLAKPSITPSLLEDHDVLPTIIPTAGSHLPVPLNTPRVNLDRLPIINLDDKSYLGFISTLSSLMFSTRERHLREQTLGNPDATTPDVTPTTRLNFKESLFTLFMLSAGLQGGQTGLFALSEPRGGSGIHALIFVSAVRLDTASHHGVPVLDAAVLPFTRELLASQELVEFLVLLRTLECCTLTVDEKELALWKRALPALAERCRDWDHLPECEYVTTGSAPVSLRPGEPVLCSCGKGKLPDNFVGVPGWEDAAKHATRVAISPVYASPLVEELVAPELARGVAEEAEGRRGPRRVCRNCGKSEEEDEGVKLKNCARCLKVAYCSSACQKKDWKKHRMECEEAGGA